MAYLLDTSALLAHFRDEPGSDRVQGLFDTEGEKILICSVSLPEFSRRLRELGASQAEITQSLYDYKQLVDEVVAVDVAVAEYSEEVIRETTTRLPLVDALIAAAAHSRQAVLVHRDAHMRSISERLLAQLDLESPSTECAPFGN